MVEETITNPNDAPAGSNVRIGARGGMYYTRGKDNSDASRAPKEPTPDETFSGPGYEVLLFREKDGFRVKYKGPNAEKILNKIKGGN